MIAKLTMSLIALSTLTAVVVSVFGEKERGRPPAALAAETDLSLEAELFETPATIMPGEAISIRMKVTNRSVNRTHRLIKLGDGSAVGWREPHVFYTVEWQDAGGTWKEAPRLAYSRCGLFAERWAEDFVDLPPGKSLECKDWAPRVGDFFEFQKAGQYRIFANYQYGTNHDGTTRTPNQRRKLDNNVRGIPNFTLTSKPIHLKLERPLELLVRQKREVKAGQETSLKELLEVELVNQSASEFEVTSPTLYGQARLHFEVQQDLQAPSQEKWHQRLELSEAPKHGKVRELEKGESVMLFGEGDFAEELDGAWSLPEVGRKKIRAVYQYCFSTDRHLLNLASDWIEIKVPTINTHLLKND